MNSPSMPLFRDALYLHDPVTEMYESDELLNEGLLSFEYPLLHASDKELENFLGSLIKRCHTLLKMSGELSETRLQQRARFSIRLVSSHRYR